MYVYVIYERQTKMNEYEYDLFVHKIGAAVTVVVLDILLTVIPLFTADCCFSLMKTFTTIVNPLASGVVTGLSIMQLTGASSKDRDEGFADNDLSIFSGAIFASSLMFTFAANHYTMSKDLMIQHEQKRVAPSSIENQLLLRMITSRAKIVHYSDTITTSNGNDVSTSAEKEAEATREREYAFQSLFFWLIAIVAESFFSFIVLACQHDLYMVWAIFINIVAADWAGCLVLGQKIQKHFRFSSVFKQIIIVIVIQSLPLLGFPLGLLTQLLPTWIRIVISRALLSCMNGIFIYIAFCDMVIKGIFAENMTRRTFVSYVLLIYLGITISVVVTWFTL